MLEKAKNFVSGWLTRFQEASPAGKVILIVAGLVFFCLLCNISGLAR